MRIHRRQFLKNCVSSTAALSLPMPVMGRLEQALAAASAPGGAAGPAHKD